MAFFGHASDLEYTSSFDDPAERSSATSVELPTGETPPEEETLEDSDCEVQEEHEKIVVSAR